MKQERSTPRNEQYRYTQSNETCWHSTAVYTEQILTLNLPPNLFHRQNFFIPQNKLVDLEDWLTNRTAQIMTVFVLGDVFICDSAIVIVT